MVYASTTRHIFRTMTPVVGNSWANAFSHYSSTKSFTLRIRLWILPVFRHHDSRFNAGILFQQIQEILRHAKGSTLLNSSWVKISRLVLSVTRHVRRGRMPYRMLWNDAQREGAKLSPDLASGLFCYVPLHKIWYSIQILRGNRA